MKVIEVNNLKKFYFIYRRESGLIPSVRSLFIRPKEVTRAVDDISFSINQGELVGFIGPNGAGKTTTLKCLSGILAPSSGKVKVLGFTPFDRREDFLKKISLVMGQKNQLWWDLPSTETFRLNKEIYDLDEEFFNKNLAELTQVLEVTDLLDVPVRKLSLGQRMKMELIAALIHRPTVLFLDEPTIGLDVVMQRKMRNFITDYNRKYKSTILLTSHYMSDVRKLCRRVIIIDHGKIIFDGKLDKLVKKYTDSKIISVVFNKAIGRSKLSKLGKIKFWQFPKLVLIVQHERVKSIATFLLNKFPVEDLNIQDPEIEDIIERVFSQNG